MADPPQIPPRPDDIRDVLQLIFMLLSDSTGLDIALDALRAGAGERSDEFQDTPPPAWAAANRLVLDALIDGLADRLTHSIDH